MAFHAIADERLDQARNNLSEIHTPMISLWSIKTWTILILDISSYGFDRVGPPPACSMSESIGLVNQRHLLIFLKLLRVARVASRPQLVNQLGKQQLPVSTSFCVKGYNSYIICSLGLISINSRSEGLGVLILPL